MPISLELCPLVPTCTSMMRPVCGITAAMYGLKCGAMMTPIPAPFDLPEQKIEGVLVDAISNGFV